MIKHVELGTETQGELKDFPLLKIYFERNGNLEKAHETVVKILAFMTHLVEMEVAKSKKTR